MESTPKMEGWGVVLELAEMVVGYGKYREWGVVYKTGKSWGRGWDIALNTTESLQYITIITIL